MKYLLFIMPSDEMIMGQLENEDDEVLRDSMRLTFLMSPSKEVHAQFVPIGMVINTKPIDIKISLFKEYVRFDETNEKVKSLIDLYEETINSLKSNILIPLNKTKIIY